MANRNRTDPHRSAQASIFRGAGQSRGSLLNSDGGKPGSDVGSTRPLRLTEEHDESNSDGRRRQPGGKHH